MFGVRKIFSIGWWRYQINAIREVLENPPARRRRLSVSAAVAVTAAYIGRSVTLRGEELEPRINMDGDGLTVQVDAQGVIGQEVSAYIGYVQPGGGGNVGSFGSGAFVDGFGQQLMGPTAVRISSPTDGFFGPNGMMQVVGAHNGQAAADDFSPGGEVVMFSSFNGDPSGRIFDATWVPGMGALYVGQAAGALSVSQPTYWRTPQTPEGGVGSTGALTSGFFTAVSEDARFVGVSDSPSYAAVEVLPQLFPLAGASVPTDISTSGTMVVGVAGTLWSSNGTGYVLVNTNNFDFTVSGGMPAWQNVEVGADGMGYLLGTYLNLNTFSEVVGLWNTNGEFLGTVGNEAVDAAVVEGSVVFAVNGPDQGYLLRASDGAMLSMATLTRQAAYLEGIFSTDGKLGLVLEDQDGFYAEVYQTFGGGNPEPQTVNLKVDFNGDGVFDRVFNDTTEVDTSWVYGATGMYNMTVVATNENGDELASFSQSITIDRWAVVERDGAQVLLVGTEANRALDVTVRGRNGGFNVQMGRERFNVNADRVQIFGSNRNDTVTLFGIDDAKLDLGNGNDRVTAFYSGFTADMGAGNDRVTGIYSDADLLLGDGNDSATLIGGILWVDAGSGNDSVTAVRHEAGFFDLGAGNDSITSLGDASFIVLGDGRDRVTSLDHRAVVVSDRLNYDAELVDLVMEELTSNNPNRGLLDDLLMPLIVDDGDRDTGITLNTWGLLLDDQDNDLIFGRRR